MKYTPGRNYGHTVAANVDRLRAAGLHERLGCLAADEFLATGKIPQEWKVCQGHRGHYSQYRGKPTSSRFFGVSRLMKSGKFRAQLTRKGHRFRAGPFDTEIEAHEAVERELERRANSECG